MARRFLVEGETGTSSNNNDSSSSSSHSKSILGFHLYAFLLLIFAILLLAASLLLVASFLWLRRRRTRAKPQQANRLIIATQDSGVVPLASEEDIVEALDDDDPKKKKKKKKKQQKMGEILNCGSRAVEVRVRTAATDGKGGGGSEVESATSEVVEPTQGNNIGWGRWYSLKELELATSGFDAVNVIGEGGCGVVYRGVLDDGSVVAVKNLHSNKGGQAQKEFEVEVEAIGRVRHKNLVGLIGYCIEGPQRILVYEYVDNGNLEQWLHGDACHARVLSWEIRMKIAIGTAKGLAYLHEGLEPKVVHRDVKSSNILLDKNWNAKVSDFGLAKLLGSDASYVTTRVMGTFGYVSPDYASTGMLNEGNDVYSFGVLLMELITGRSPVDYTKPQGEINLVDWFKGMVGCRRGEEMLDPRIESPPSSRALKRVLLVCLRCVDMDASKRPKMGQIVHMLEADEQFSFRALSPPSTSPRPLPQTGLISKDNNDRLARESPLRPTQRIK